MTPAPSPAHTERSTLAACIAHVAGAAASDVPLHGDEQRAWLVECGLGLVPVADAATFSWAATYWYLSAVPEPAGAAGAAAAR